MNFCIQCGAACKPEDRFCQACGAALPGTADSATPLTTPSTTASPAESSAAVPPTLAVPLTPEAAGAVPVGQSARSFPKPSRKLVILSSIIVVLVIAALSAVLVVQNMLRGGAASPEEAVSKVIESVSDNDIVGLYTMVAPRERDAVKRTQDAFVEKYKEFGLADVANAISENTATGSELAFDGVEISILGTTPRVENLSDELATVTLDTGEVKWSIDPSQTKGIIRAQLDAVNSDEKSTGSMFLGDVLNGEGVTLMVTKVDGRWYVSPLLSSLDAINTQAQLDRGVVPATSEKGAESPESAAEAAVSAIPRIASDGLEALAPYLASAEAEALYLYGDLAPGVIDSSITLDAVTFTAGPQNGDRATAYVDSIGYSVSGDKVEVSSTCVNGEWDEEELCLNGSGYFGGGYYSAQPLLSYFADNGKFALTTVKEDGAWKVSVLDTAADHAISWVNSITKEQAMAMLGWERAGEVTGTLAFGTESTVEYNSAGYAVMELVLTDTKMLQLSDSSSAGGTVYDSAGEWISNLDSNDGYSSPGELKPGSYTVVLKAGSDWFGAFIKQGNEVAYSEPVMVEEYLEPPTIDGYSGFASGSFEWFSGSQQFDVQVPEGNDVNLVLVVTSDGLELNSGPEGAFTVTIDGDYVSSFVPRTGNDEVIPFPSDSLSHTVSVSLDGTGYYPLINFDLRFERK